MGKVFDEKAEKTNLDFDSAKLFAGFFLFYFPLIKHVFFNSSEDFKVLQEEFNKNMDDYVNINHISTF